MPQQLLEYEQANNYYFNKLNHFSHCVLPDTLTIAYTQSNGPRKKHAAGSLVPSCLISCSRAAALGAAHAATSKPCKLLAGGKGEENGVRADLPPSALYTRAQQIRPAR